MECGYSHWIDMDESSVLPNDDDDKYVQMAKLMEDFCRVSRSRPQKSIDAPNFSNRGDVMTASTVMKAWNKFHSNNFSIFNYLLTSFAAGVYPYAALLNHSCQPNCILRFILTNDQKKQKPILEIVAAKDIQPGDELCHSYVDIIQGLDRGVDTILQEKYGWPSCFCSKCRRTSSTDDDQGTEPTKKIVYYVENTTPPTAEEWMNPFAWEKPYGNTMMNTVSKVLDKSLYESNHDEDTKEVRKIIQQHLINATNAVVKDDNPELEVFYLQQALDVYKQSQLPPLGPQMYQILSRLLAPQLLLQDFAAALTTCQHIIACLGCAIQRISSSNNLYYHPLLGVQLFTLADLYEGNGHTEEATRTYQWCRRILRVTHGETSDMVKRLDSFLL